MISAWYSGCSILKISIFLLGDEFDAFIQVCTFQVDQ